MFELMFAAVCLSVALSAEPDTVVEGRPQNLDEVVIVSDRREGTARRSAKGQAASIDEHLSRLRGVSMVRRGSYAWEPVVNGMQTERLSTTIDGMKIFYACTDKMDPVTSYVESGNLQSISLNSGLDGNPQATGNIGGALDLKLRKAGFGGDPQRVSLLAAHEWNGHVQVYGADAAFSRQRVYVNAGAFYRHGDDYTTGDGRRLGYTQFTKVNAFTNAGYRLTGRDVVEATFIADRATDVGYPALNMDVAKAEALITSVAYRHLFDNSSWETKAYYNHITHEMDDTGRPDVAIHMDMPGISWTAGMYSLFNVQCSMFNIRNDMALNYDLYYNRLFADMTMYPGGAAPMYMVTWPDVGTLNSGVAVTDNISIGRDGKLRLSAKVSYQQQRLHDDEGYRALSVFFPGMNDRYHQTTARVAASYEVRFFPRYENSSRREERGGRSEDSFLDVRVGGGWGSRAPTVTEAYGYYLNNTFDRYDYMGNPSLSNESAVELNADMTWRVSRKALSRYEESLNGGLTIGVSGNVFLFTNYIIGQMERRLSPMTVGAKGVKVYYNSSRALIANAAMTAAWQLTENVRWNGRIAYAIGNDADGDALPLVSPLSWQTGVSWSFSRKFFSRYEERLRVGATAGMRGARYEDSLNGGLTVELDVRGNAAQHRPGSKYGEQSTRAWAVADLTASYVLSRYEVRVGVENLLDKQYATYADWNHIPQKGRNVFASISFSW